MERCPVKIVIFDPASKGHVMASIEVKAVVYRRSADKRLYFRLGGIPIPVVLNQQCNCMIARLSMRQAHAYFVAPSEPTTNQEIPSNV